jgi:alkanesulfonate monooxygenase SsuD/methylene tetrahydromethanopterin reductase-like flavin-dependent oxidoreductase (luciferase family)
VRFGVVVAVSASTGAAIDPTGVAADAEEAGLDLIWLQGDPSLRGSPADTLTAAAFVAARTSAVRVVTQVPVGPHPLQIAEQAAVVDNVSAGRLVLVLADTPGPPGTKPAEDLLAETAEVLLKASAPLPFRHQGSRWTIPAGMDGHRSERRISVTPNTAQLELPIWLSGPAAVAVGSRFGLSHVSTVMDTAARARCSWRRTEDALGRAAVRMRRPAIRELSCGSGGDFDVDGVVRELTAEAEAWRLDVVALRLPVSLDRPAIRRAVRRIASLVRPALQMDRIPEHVQRYWRDELEARLLD